MGQNNTIMKINEMPAKTWYRLNPEERKRSFENFVSKQIPCVIFTTMTEPDEDMLDMGRKYNVPILVTEKTT